ncbi:MAG TPA: TonB-dependent receptor [Steroidobacteraceae bacterium]|nr:TonB-dependent receptor [Steroidobacteraceae bacterium]
MSQHGTHSRVSLLILALSVASPFLAQLARADTVLEEVVVTAQKREQNLQNVGTSITALGSADLQAGGLKDATAIAAMTPGLQFNQYSPTITVYNLRGVSQNDFSDHQEAPVAVYVDDAYVASMGALAGSMYDVDRVEILRGPQGTLFGRNATGGLIHYISKRPTADTSGYVDVTAGNYGTLNTQGAFNGALSDDVFGRLAFATDSHNGYIHNRIGPDTNDQKQYALRGQLLFKPSADGEILLNVHGLKNDHEVSGIYSWQASHPDPATGLGYFIGPNDLSNGVCGGCDAFGYKNPSSDLFNQAENRAGLFDRTVWGSTVHVDWNLAGGAHFASVTDYLHMHKDYGEDSDMGPFSIFNYDTHQKYHQFSQELRLNGSQGALRWIAGVYFLSYTTDNQALTDFTGIGGLPGGGAIFSLKSDSYSGFGQLENDFTANWTGILGARYTNDRKEFRFHELDPFGAGSADFDDSHSWGMTSAKLELDRKFGTDNMVYGSYNRGAKGGGYSAPSTGLVDTATLRFNPETLNSFELGFKSEFWNRSARLNAAVFHYDYKNYQGFVLQGLTQVVVNLDAKVSGAEVEFAVVPTEGLNIEIGASALDTKADKVPLPSGIALDRDLPQAPKLSLNASVRYQWPAAGGKLSIEADAKWNDSQYMELVNAPVDYQKGYALSNARFGYTSGSGDWDAHAYVRNLSDERYKVYNLDLSVLGFNQGVYGTPRTYGIEFAYHWGK